VSASALSNSSYFGVRLTVPGFIFLLFIFASNKESIYLFPDMINPLSGLIMIFVAIIGSPGIGFLIMQIWHLFFEGLSKGPYSKENLDWALVISSKLKLKVEPKEFVSFLTQQLPEENRIYLSRRMDMINTLGTVIVAAIAGLVVGTAFKFFFIKSIDLTDPFFILVLIMGIVLIVAMTLNFTRAFKESQSFLRLLLRTYYPASDDYSQWIIMLRINFLQRFRSKE
jgi:hypothetical protein